MVLLYVFIALCAVFGLRACTEQESADYLGRTQSAAIKGICVLLVFASHAAQYLIDTLPQTALNAPLFTVRAMLGQLIVVPFLFYSGYGVRYSFETKGTAYLAAFPRNRILKTYLHIALILCLYLVMQLSFGERYSAGEVLQAFLLWRSIGNSTWYLFAILFLYLAAAVSFFVFQKPRAAVLSVAVLSVAYMLVMSRFKDAFWYNTVLLYALGMAAYDHRDGFRRLARDHVGVLIGAALGFALLFVLWLKRPFSNALAGAFLYTLMSAVFMTAVLAFLVRVKVQNRLLIWLGGYVFEIYFLQRLPMRALTNLGLAAANPFLWLVCCAAATLLLAVACRKAFSALDSVLFQ